MQQSTHGGAAINKQSTRLDKEEEKKKKFSFFFSFFPSLFDSVTIAAGKEVEKASSREPEWMGYNTETSPWMPSPKRKVKAHAQSEREEVGHNGGSRRHFVECCAGGQR